jgi:hypothetical protein
VLQVSAGKAEEKEIVVDVDAVVPRDLKRLLKGPRRDFGCVRAPLDTGSGCGSEEPHKREALTRPPE